MSRLTDRLERDLREVAAGAHPSPSAWESIAARLGDDEGSEFALTPAPDPGTSRRRVWLAVAAVVALVGVIAGSAVLDRVGEGDAVSTADQAATAFHLADLTTTFVSPRNGFSVRYSDRGEGTVTPARQLLDFRARADDGFDVVDTGSGAVFRGASKESRGRASTDAGIDDALSDVRGSCRVPRREQAEITIDGRSGRVAECPNHIQATVLAGGRVYLFTLVHDRDDARALFDAFIATIDLTPETAVDFPAMTTTFVSPTYGYSFRYHDRGGLQPATELWDPGNQPLEDRNFDARFDGVETGLGAYFEGASTPIPAGVAVDAWIDEHVTAPAAGGCGVPRSQQAQITIDGHSGRMAACDHIEATVVAGGRLYLFIGTGASRRNQAWFDAWIATIDLTPETAAQR